MRRTKYKCLDTRIINLHKRISFIEKSIPSASERFHNDTVYNSMQKSIKNLEDNYKDLRNSYEDLKDRVKKEEESYNPWFYYRVFLKGYNEPIAFEAQFVRNVDNRLEFCNWTKDSYSIAAQFDKEEVQGFAVTEVDNEWKS